MTWEFIGNVVGIASSLLLGVVFAATYVNTKYTRVSNDVYKDVVNRIYAVMLAIQEFYGIEALRDDMKRLVAETTLLRKSLGIEDELVEETIKQLKEKEKKDNEQ